jgi:hypothetical protein
MQRDILVGRHQAKNEGFVRIELRAWRLTLPGGFERTLRAPLLVPFDRRGWRHREPSRRRPGRHTAIDRAHDTLAKLNSVRAHHICLQKQLETLKHVSRPVGIPFVDSVIVKAALVRWKLPQELGHNPVGGWSVMAMLAVIAVQGSMGLFGTDGNHYDAPLSKLVSTGTARFLTELHEDGFNIILVLVGVHLSAIAFYLVVFRKNLVSPMIRGTTLAEPGIIPARVRPGRVWLAVICLAIAATCVIWVVYFT